MFDSYPISVTKMNKSDPVHQALSNCWRVGNTFYIGRGSPLGNPYSSKDSKHDVVQVDTSDEAISNFDSDMRSRRLTDHAYKALNEIKEASRVAPVTLVCFCKPNPCHGDSIRQFLEEIK